MKHNSTVERVAKFYDIMKAIDNTVISQEFNDWLIKYEFFDKPAAIKYHGNYTGGLLDHSAAVVTSLVSLTDSMKIKWQNPRSPYIVGMFHDLCKIDDYERSPEGTWTYHNNKVLPGHGEKSIMLLSQFINLTEEEIYCIRFHMGAYEIEDWDSYDKAIRKYETVLWTHTADMYASKVLNK